MKNVKSLTSLTLSALIFAVVLSCDEHEDKLEAKNDLRSGTSANLRTNSARTVNFDGTEGGPIDLVTAKEWAANFRNTIEDPNEIQAHYFVIEIIEQILKQSDCVGIRIYYAIDAAGEKKLILVGVDSNGENLLPLDGGKANGDQPIIADYSLPCPDYCPGKGLN